jgi:ribosome hibernation promoting factor
MTINIRATGCELTPALRQYVEEKIESLEKYGTKMFQADVHIGKDTNHHNKGEVFSCSVTLELVGDVVKVERTSDDLYKAIDKVKDHLRETLAQRKDRIIESHQHE